MKEGIFPKNIWYNCLVFLKYNDSHGIENVIMDSYLKIIGPIFVFNLNFSFV